MKPKPITVAVQPDVHQAIREESILTGKKGYRVVDDILRPALLPRKPRANSKGK
jgi:hypothetical protein